MKIGVVYPQTEYPADPAAINDYAQTAEGLGFSHILAYDHVLGANPNHPNADNMPYTILDPFQEPLTLFAFMAGITQRIEFASGVIILPQRQTALFAKQAATLDVLCAGRLRIGIGLGWNEIEYEAMNEDFHTRGRKIEEQVQVLRLLWTQPLVDYHGKWHNLPHAGLNPLPVQRPIPLWFGGGSEPALRRAARLGDGWISTTRDAMDVDRTLEIIYQALEEAGRSTEQFGLEARIGYGTGDPKIWGDHAAAWRARGATYLSFNTMRAGLVSTKDHLTAIGKFARNVGAGGN